MANTSHNVYHVKQQVREQTEQTTSTSKSRICVDCDADISHRYHTAKLCDICAAIRKRETSKRLYRERLKGWRSRITNAVRIAIDQGKLTAPYKLKCTDCGARATEYDHRDYAKPLDVEPVCRSCNKKRGPAKNYGVAA